MNYFKIPTLFSYCTSISSGISNLSSYVIDSTYSSMIKLKLWTSINGDFGDLNGDFVDLFYSEFSILFYNIQ